ncbi:hypothetical protein EYM_03700 [Ignicoccus islandicus DSM 13165]|uniref:NADH-quinone oxidoreductase subunit J n=1 Tax=Ignicoccus islandicus DSM 13165 TaxID=940295 RepID=A0A0U2WNA9_9CREN|nr:NADH-quinone oxidoreductase subunit J [Ignicoccus islandicus]ALU12433.1 hypothetical protein EYM_03700 [Ignicoccus islandicus DSM 13165]
MIETFILLMTLATIASAAVVWDPDLVRAAISLVVVFLLSGLALLTLGSWFIGALQVILGAGAVAILALYAAITSKGRREILKAPQGGTLGALVLSALGIGIGFLTISTPGIFTLYTSTTSNIASTLFGDLGLVATLSILLLVALISSAYIIRYIVIEGVRGRE